MSAITISKAKSISNKKDQRISEISDEFVTSRMIFVVEPLAGLYSTEVCFKSIEKSYFSFKFSSNPFK